MRFNDSRRKFPPLANSQTSSKASRERVEGIGVRVWGGKDPVEPNRGNVGRDEVVSIRVFDVMMGLGEKAFEGGKLRQGISRFETRGPKHVTKVGLWRVERGSLKGWLGARMGRNYQARDSKSRVPRRCLSARRIGPLVFLVLTSRKTCANRESNPALKLGKLQCYRYNIGAAWNSRISGEDITSRVHIIKCEASPRNLLHRPHTTKRGKNEFFLQRASERGE